MRWLRNLFSPAATSAFSTAALRDAGNIAALHAASFHRGWSEDEIERLLVDRNVVGDIARVGTRFAGFILSRLAADEAEVLSIAVSKDLRGRNIGSKLLHRHLGRLAAYGAKAVFLEVEENNVAALKLYRHTNFTEVGRRASYYRKGNDAAVNALVLRRNLS